MFFTKDNMHELRDFADKNIREYGWDELNPFLVYLIERERLTLNICYIENNNIQPNVLRASYVDENYFLESIKRSASYANEYSLKYKKCTEDTAKFISLFLDDNEYVPEHPIIKFLVWRNSVEKPISEANFGKSDRNVAKLFNEYVFKNTSLMKRLAPKQKGRFQFCFFEDGSPVLVASEKIFLSPFEVFPSIDEDFITKFARQVMVECYGDQTYYPYLDDHIFKVIFEEDICKELEKDLSTSIFVWLLIKNAQNAFNTYLKPSLYRCGIKKAEISITPPWSDYAVLETVKLRPIHITLNSEKDPKDTGGEYFRHIFSALEITNTILAPLLDDLSVHFRSQGIKYFKTEISIHTFDGQKYVTRNSFLDLDGDEY